MSPDEILALLSGTWELTSHFLEQRISYHVVLGTTNGTILYLGKHMKRVVLEELEEEKNTRTQTELNGMTAYPGKVCGIARVVLKKEGIIKFQKGEILITTMTSPEFVPAMRIAKAIVTDEGGVLCHAAITAREFKIPCVIGTQNATKFFKQEIILMYMPIRV